MIGLAYSAFEWLWKRWEILALSVQLLVLLAMAEDPLTGDIDERVAAIFNDGADRLDQLLENL